MATKRRLRHRYVMPRTNTGTPTLSASSGPPAQVRTGTVAAATKGSVTILVGGTTFQASYVLPFGQEATAANMPIVGTLVSVVRQDATWQCLGRIAGAGENLIDNGSFEETGVGTFPQDWILYNLVGTSSAVVMDDFAVDGGNSALVLSNSAASGQSFLYSTPAAVTAGEKFSLSAYAGASYGANSPVAVDASLYALWFSNDTNLYPTTSSADSLIATATNVVQAPPFTPLSGTVTAPVTGFVRLALRSTVADTTGMLWDFAILRKNETP